ncbi:CYFA0S12e02696g1_1 [Cyberlindnera fabianii]|nr:CYFA0S12e02696g1_1 [Cyberlindnera fabianii]
MTRITSFSWDSPAAPNKQDVGTDAGYVSQGEESEDGIVDDERSDSEDSVTRDLNNIGSFTRLRLPTFNWSSQTVSNDQTVSRREQLTNLIEDLKSGWSLQSALDRFQTIRSVLESQIEDAIENNVDSDIEYAEDEPHVIRPAAEPRDVPMLEQVIIPQGKEPGRKQKKKQRKYQHQHALHNQNPEVMKLAVLPDSHKEDELFLRKRIIKIRQLDIAEEAKNRLMQKLMMGAHYDKVKFVDNDGNEVVQINTKGHTDDDDDDDDDDDEEDDDEEDPDLVVVLEEDTQPSYHDEDELVLGCAHYQRNCKMECPDCRKWCCCPKCHDEIVTDHKFKRERTRHVMCMHCWNVQAPSQFCDECDAQLALYFCEKCVLYDNDENKDIYHCDDCGICRLGLGLGQDFFHCKGCNACLSIELQNEHRCIERATQSDCPICGEYMFTSTKPVVFMSCGHAIHQTCFDDHSKHSYKCPTCQKTVLNMEAQFRVLDMEISLQPLPEPYCQWRCILTCNDCNARSSCSYHVLGLKCDNCKSYNTVQQKLIKPEETDDDSDVSTTTNQLRTRLNVRNLRNIPLSSHLLSTNYNIENIESDVDSNAGAGVSGNALNNDRMTADTEERVLTIPQQLMNNFDHYLQSMGTSTTDDEDDEDDANILRINKALKSTRSTFMSDSGGDEDDGNMRPSMSIGETLRGFLKRGRHVVADETGEEGEEDEVDESDELNFNGF